jgi:hypothetical protein
MKRTLLATISLLALAGLLTATVAAQSLGEYARQQRARKGPTPADVKEYTNDNLPTSGGLGTSSASSATTPGSAAAAADKSKSGESAEKDQAEVEKQWRDKFAEQKKVIATLERELDVATREMNNRQSQAQVNTYDVGARLRNPVLFAADNKKYVDEMEGKKKALEEARQKLEDMKDDLRKAGLPGAWAN